MVFIEYIYCKFLFGGIWMQLIFERKDDVLIVKLMGELDHHSAEEVRIKIDNKIDETGLNKVIFDFSGVNFMDSSGIGVIIGRYKKVKDFNGKVAIINLRPHIKKIFELGGIFKIIKEYDNLQKALLEF
ncbi:anti-sigma F factor antagonist (spoIIAA-2); anti sigma b factor antagonist RsbV [Caloramator australicus RC3]|uniref:Anti-sigma F factor antagonist n=2 Tax=Caloramator TaxID=44258 RepID=I7LHR4_9CLOT|nr:anti-sigma F factor antagonist (spoIIAA-2); anti sigma b factor antagonist RsbV [Caloramator australicus RC3]